MLEGWSVGVVAVTMFFLVMMSGVLSGEFWDVEVTEEKAGFQGKKPEENES